jgi:hypothetical protein
MLQNVPNEMREYAQWVCYRIEGLGKKKTKIPYCPQTGRPASVKNPGQWTTYDVAVSCLVSGEYHGIGFVLTHNDPFFFVDLDDIDCPDAQQRQIDIAADFDTYQERSPSGSGLHIIGKGSVPSGRRVSKLGIEVYSNERYMTVTGDVFDNKNEIKLEQAKLSLLWEMLGSNRGRSVEVHSGQEPEVDDDLTVYNKAAAAANGEKFLDLWNGNWQKYHFTQSEADLALCNIIAFWTPNKDQLRRMFYRSGLFRAEKSTRPSYIEPILKMAYDKIGSTLNFDVLFNELQVFRKEMQSPTLQKETYQAPLFQQPVKIEKPKSTKGNSWEESSIPKPPGIMGQVAEYIYEQSPYPIPEVSICAAIGFMAGVCGKAYNISDSGLNHYVMLLAKTGTGKDGGRKGVNKLFNHFIDQFPIVGDFEGPSDFASGQSIVTHLSNHKTGCFLSVLGEFAVKLCEISNDKFGPHVSLKRMLLDLFTKSAIGDSFKPTVYSDVTKNTNLVKSPCLSIFAEGQPELFFQNINEQTVESGLIPRFTFIHYEGKRIKRKKNFSQTVISPELESNLKSLFSTVFTYMNAQSVNQVEMDSEGDRILDEFDDHCDEMIDSHNGMIRHLWTRCSFKALKLSALVAVGLNPVKPVITKECAEWAIKVILLDIAELSSQFEAGRIGGDHGELLQQTEVRKAVQEYLMLDFAKVKPIGTSLLNKDMLDHGVVPMFYLSHKCIRKACFRKDRIGATNSVKRALQCLCDNGELYRLKKTESQTQFGFSGECFAILNKDILGEVRQRKFES